MKKQAEKTAQTKENLTQAFWWHYCKKRIEHITVKDITERAGYNRSTFYEYFTDVYDVLEQLEDSLINYIRENVLESLDTNSMMNLPSHLANVYDSIGNYLSVLLGENGNPRFTGKIKNAMRAAILNAFGIKKIDSRTMLIYEFALSAILGTLTYWYQNRDIASSDELVVLVRSMLMNGPAYEIKRTLTDMF